MTVALSLVCLTLATGWVGMLITHRFDRAAIRRLQREAYTDDLTGLPNRRSFMYGLGVLAASSESWTVAIIDVDEFKVINDRLGHVAGDAALAGIADALRRSDWVAARLGGDEFAVVFRHDAISSATVLQRAIRRIDIVDPVTGVTFGVSLSVGLAAYESGAPLPVLLYRADCALYQSKRSGRQISIWGMGSDSAVERKSRSTRRHGERETRSVSLTQEWA